MFHRPILSLTVLALLAACAADGSRSASIVGSTFDSARYTDSDTSLLDLCGSYDVSTDPRAGTYVGFWRQGAEEVLQSAIIIDDIAPDGTVQLLYAHGTYAQWDINYSQCERFAGRFRDDDTLIVDFRDGHKGTFDFIDADQVNGTYTSSNGDTYGTFSRI